MTESTESIVSRGGGPEGAPASASAERAQREAELLVVRCQLGDRQAFDDLIAAWHGPLFQYARRMSVDEDAARGVVQDVWLRVVRGSHTLREPSRAPAD